jgi:cobalt-zinc-cadmium efflux system membrane fusion protein
MPLLNVATVVAAVIAGACGNQPATRSAQPPAAHIVETHAEEANAIHLSEDMTRDLRISTAAVMERPGAAEVTALGEVVADQARYAEVSPPSAGQVVRVLVDTNSAVSRGTPLAQLRSPELGRARANLLSAEARRDLARQTLDRKRSLADERIVALREVQEAEGAFRAADADVRAANASLQALGVAEDGLPISEDGSLFYARSPIPGRVLDRHAVLGQYAEPSAPLFTVADLSRVWVMAQAFERDAVNVRVGSTAHVTLAALPGQEFDGRVALVGRQVEPGSRTLAVRIEVANPEGVLRPGMSASSRLEAVGQSRTILAVPAAALQRVGERWLAFIPKAQYEYEMRPVGRGRDLGNDVEVVSGLRAGETVVVEGAFLLKAEAEKRTGADEGRH